MPRIADDKYRQNVFINCPFDAQYLKLFRAIIFTVYDCGYIARSALEADDGSEVRVGKILRIIRECRIGIHDISRTEANGPFKLPRFNMPLELGMFLGAKEYGTAAQRAKSCLILDRNAHRYQRFISDIGGQDIHAHGVRAATAVREVRNFLRNLQPSVHIPGSEKIYDRYCVFTRELPILCRNASLNDRDLIFNDYANLVEEWLKVHPMP